MKSRFDCITQMFLFFAVCLSSSAFAQGTMPPVYGNPGDDLGYSVSGLGDVNGDGFADFVAGARYAGAREAHVRVFSGLDGSLLWGVPDESGPGTGGALGWSVAGLGDVNGDGIPDVLAGAPSESVNQYEDGSAKVFSGSDGSLLYSVSGDAAYDRFGSSVAAAGDVNGDGVPDFIVGTDAPLSRPGYARVFSGSTGAVLFTLHEPTPPPSAPSFSRFGAVVSGAGDVNGDGFADLIVGASLDDRHGANAGSATLYSGRDGHVLYTFLGSAPADYFGTSVSGAGDVDGDGFADVIAGAPGFDTAQGAGVGLARVLSGRTGAVLYSFTGDVRDRFFGMSVSKAGDVNGDGFADVIVGTFGFPTSVTTPDYAQVFSGKDGSVLFTERGTALHDGFGWAVSDAGDVDGDGMSDVIVGAYKDANAGMRAGSSVACLGRTDYGMMLTGPSPGIAGTMNTLEVSGASPGANVLFLYGRRLGVTSLPRCPSVTLSIRNPMLASSGSAFTTGRTMLQMGVPPSQTGRTILIQAVEMGDCRVTNLVRATFR